MVAFQEFTNACGGRWRYFNYYRLTYRILYIYYALYRHGWRFLESLIITIKFIMEFPIDWWVF